VYFKTEILICIVLFIAFWLPLD